MRTKLIGPARMLMGRIVEVVRTFVPSEWWPEVQAALRGDTPIEDLGAEESDGLEMVEIDDGYDEG
jgi:hypothetical protein